MTNEKKQKTYFSKKRKTYNPRTSQMRDTKTQLSSSKLEREFSWELAGVGVETASAHATKVATPKGEALVTSEESLEYLVWINVI